MMLTQFDSSWHPSRERVEAWRHAVGHYFYTGTRVPHGSERFQAQLAAKSVGGITILETHLSSMNTRCDIRHLPQNDRNLFFVSLMLAGRATLRSHWGDLVQDSGEIVTWGVNTSHHWESEGPIHSLCFKVPSTLLSDADRKLMTQPNKLQSRMPVHSLIGSMMRSISEVSWRSDSTIAHRLRVAFLYTLLSGLEVSQAGLERREDDLLRAAHQYILSRLGDQDLTATLVARALNVSVRTLQRMFAANGTTVVTWIIRQRLEHSRHLLSAGACRGISDVALMCGFKSFSHFSRAFKAAYGVSPVKMTHGALGQ